MLNTNRLKSDSLCETRTNTSKRNITMEKTKGFRCVFVPFHRTFGIPLFFLLLFKFHMLVLVIVLVLVLIS